MPRSLCLSLKTNSLKQILTLKNNPTRFYDQGTVLNSVSVKGLITFYCMIFFFLIQRIQLHSQIHSRPHLD